MIWTAEIQIEMRILSSRCNGNLSNCKLTWKRFRCFEGIRIHDLCASAVALYQLSYEDQYNVGSRCGKGQSLVPASNKFDHITPVLHELGWLTIEELLRLRVATMIFKCLSGLVPSYLSTKFVKRSQTHSYCTRRNNQLLNLPQCHLRRRTMCTFLPFQGV